MRAGRTVFWRLRLVMRSPALSFYSTRSKQSENRAIHCDERLDFGNTHFDVHASWNGCIRGPQPLGSQKSRTSLPGYSLTAKQRKYRAAEKVFGCSISRL